MIWVFTETRNTKSRAWGEKKKSTTELLISYEEVYFYNSHRIQFPSTILKCYNHAIVYPPQYPTLFTVYLPTHSVNEIEILESKWTSNSSLEQVYLMQ